MASKVKEGFDYCVEINYSPRSGDECMITGHDLCDRQLAFNLTEEADQAFDEAKTEDEVDATVLKLYKGKRPKYTTR